MTKLILNLTDDLSFDQSYNIYDLLEKYGENAVIFFIEDSDYYSSYVYPKVSYSREETDEEYEKRIEKEKNNLEKKKKRAEKLQKTRLEKAKQKEIEEYNIFLKLKKKYENKKGDL